MFCIVKAFVQNDNDKRERKKFYMIEISNLSGINDGRVRGYFQKGCKIHLSFMEPVFWAKVQA
jgi:hypothetical protein